MESFPIELIERVLRFCPGFQFSLSARVSTNWLKANANIERTDQLFWRNKCRKEIDANLIEDLNPYHNSIVLLDSNQCKEVYIKWYRTTTIPNLAKDVFKCGETFGSNLSRFENITALTVTGNLVITGHRSGKVLLIDVLNNSKPLEITRHLLAVNDLVPINMVGEDRYELHNKRNAFEMEFPSFSNHHHVITIGEDHRIHIALICEKGVGKEFEIEALNTRHFLKGRVCRDMLAVSSKEAVDISLFRLILPKQGVVPIKVSVKAQVIKVISCRQLFKSANHWLGLFTFSDLKLNVFCHEDNMIACSNVSLNLSLPESDKAFNWKWSSINELEYEFETKPGKYEEYDDLNVIIRNGYSFGEKIFFLITFYNETIFTTDAKTFHLCELDHCMKKADRVMCLSLFGTALAWGTSDGYVYVHHCPTLERLRYLTHFRPLFSERVSKDPIIKISIKDTGMGPIVAAATARNVYLLKWSSDRNKWIKGDVEVGDQIKVITID